MALAAPERLERPKASSLKLCRRLFSTIAVMVAVGLTLNYGLLQNIGISGPSYVAAKESVGGPGKKSVFSIAEEEDTQNGIQDWGIHRRASLAGNDIPLYPRHIADYRHTIGTCNTSYRIPMRLSGVVLNGTQVWSGLYPDHREFFETEHERCHYVMARMLAIFKAVLSHANNSFVWFVTYGTLLGAVRHGGWIPWDVDIDIAIPHAGLVWLRKNWRVYFPRDMFLQTEKTESSFHMWTGKERGIRVKDRYSSFIGMKFSVYKRGKRFKMRKFHLGAGLDIIPLEKHGLGRFKMLGRDFDYKTILPLSTVCFENIDVPAPANVTRFLIDVYGPDYMQFPLNISMPQANSLPCKATTPSRGSVWSLVWKHDHETPNGTPVVSPRGDPHGSVGEDIKEPFRLYPNEKGYAQRLGKT